MAGLAAGSAADALVVVVAVGFLGQGVGFGLLRPAITTALADAVDERDLGMAGAAERLTGQVGVAFGITILATVYGGDVDRFAPAFAVGAVFAVIGTLAALGMRRHGQDVRRIGGSDRAHEPDADGAGPFVPVAEQPR